MTLDPRTLPLKGLGLPGGPTLLRALARLGVTTAADLLLYLPRRYEDRRAMTPIDHVQAGVPATIRARVADVRIEKTWRRGVQRTIATLVDESGAIDAIWYGRRFVEHRLHVGQEIVASGRVKAQGWNVTLEAPEFSPLEAAGDGNVGAGRIVPIYRLTAGITAPTLRRAIRALLDQVGANLPDPLPDQLRTEQELMGIGKAIEQLHWPEEFALRDAALRRLAFDELLAVQLALVRRRRHATHGKAPTIVTTAAAQAAIEAGLLAGLSAARGGGLKLTADQRAAIRAILSDLQKATPMVRLLQGDVGTGKTLVAFAAAAATATAGYQTALLSPTELLARQHAATAKALLAPLGVRSELLVASDSAAVRRDVRAAAAAGDAQLVIGTHALLSGGTEFARLGLVVIDEQHRFGVEERARLLAKGEGEPHLLLMTATPIPRTIAQLLYADVASCELHALPAGRQQIRTAIRTPKELERLWSFVASEAAAGRQTFVVVPRIEGDVEGGEEQAWYADAALDGAAAGSIEGEAEAIRAILPDLRIGIVHGAQPVAERIATMGAFTRGELDILVGTTVVEVGVDVPAASVMIVLHAERFGLATLHQLRGRVGRGGHEGWCVLVSETEDEVALARLRAIESTRDGFLLAERDMELRGEGSVLGTSQSGLPPLRIATLSRAADRACAVIARAVAEDLLDAEGEPLSAARDVIASYASGWPVGATLADASDEVAPA